MVFNVIISIIGAVVIGVIALFMLPESPYKNFIAFMLGFLGYSLYFIMCLLYDIRIKICGGIK